MTGYVLHLAVSVGLLAVLAVVVRRENRGSHE